MTISILNFESRRVDTAFIAVRIDDILATLHPLIITLQAISYILYAITFLYTQI
jgi:hypothetical protein